MIVWFFVFSDPLSIPISLGDLLHHTLLRMINTLNSGGYAGWANVVRSGSQHPDSRQYCKGFRDLLIMKRKGRRRVVLMEHSKIQMDFGEDSIGSVGESAWL